MSACDQCGTAGGACFELECSCACHERLQVVREIVEWLRAESLARMSPQWEHAAAEIERRFGKREEG